MSPSDPLDPSMRGTIVLLGGSGGSTRIVCNALRASFPDVLPIIEPPLPRSKLVRGRLKRLGVVPVAGQIAFMLLVEPWLRARGRDRVAEIKRKHALDESAIAEPVVHVPSVNSEEARAAIRSARPSVVVVNGTRIIGRETLAAIDCPIINTHAGITPQYRGVHGGYWALVEGRPDLVGTTVHFVDPGIDTGAVIAQPTFEVTRADSFATYPTLHLAAGLPALIDAVRGALRGDLKEAPPRADLESRLRHHPTLWGYLYARLRSGVR